MDLTADAWIPFPRPVVFAAYRDELDKLTDYLPNVRRIEFRSRTEHPPVVELVNIWHGGGEIPPAARAFLSEQMLSWTDYARWDEAAWTCAWRIETHAFSEAVRCQGKNTFVEEGGKTRLEIRGNLTIDSSRARGVPRLLVSTVNRTVEELLGSRIRPNLLDVSAGLTKYLERKA
jgi:hypothetical protein